MFQATYLLHIVTTIACLFDVLYVVHAICCHKISVHFTKEVHPSIWWFWSYHNFVNPKLKHSRYSLRLQNYSKIFLNLDTSIHRQYIGISKFKRNLWHPFKAEEFFLFFSFVPSVKWHQDHTSDGYTPGWKSSRELPSRWEDRAPSLSGKGAHRSVVLTSLTASKWQNVSSKHKQSASLSKISLTSKIDVEASIVARWPLVSFITSKNPSLLPGKRLNFPTSTRTQGGRWTLSRPWDHATSVLFLPVAVQEVCACVTLGRGDLSFSLLFFIFVGKTYHFLEQVRYIFASTPRAYIFKKQDQPRH
jgi:hypothetical protein